jgi:DNA-binding transcriptional regulator YdaS (Cro superfamily)
MNFRAHLKRAIKMAGTQYRLSKLSGISDPMIRYYLTKAKNIGPDAALKIDALNWGITAADLRPDLFGPDAGWQRKRK